MEKKVTNILPSTSFLLSRCDRFLGAFTGVCNYWHRYVYFEYWSRSTDGIVVTAALPQSIVFTMDNKRDATRAGLPWSIPQLRQSLGGPLLPGMTPPATSSAPIASPALPTASPSSMPDPTGPTPYASDTSELGAPPFPHMDTSEKHRTNHAFFTAPSVLQSLHLRQPSEGTVDQRNQHQRLFSTSRAWAIFLFLDRIWCLRPNCGLLASLFQLFQHSNTPLRGPTPLRTTKLQFASNRPRSAHAYTNDGTIFFTTQHCNTGSPTPRLILVCKLWRPRVLLSPLSRWQLAEVSWSHTTAVFRKNDPAAAGCVCVYHLNRWKIS